MDPISQGIVGALWAASLAPKHKLKPTLIAGALAGVAADLDVFISSSTDPLLFLEYHRQFTHSLIFVPIGALIVALCLWPFLKRSLQPKELLTACFLGYLSHGLLDACTTYGTQLLWPFTDDRVAWNVISIVDPLFTLPLLITVVLGVRAKRVNAWPRIGLIWLFAYLGAGEIQRQRAETAVKSPRPAATPRPGSMLNRVSRNFCCGRSFMNTKGNFSSMASVLAFKPKSTRELTSRNWIASGQRKTFPQIVKRFKTLNASAGFRMTISR